MKPVFQKVHHPIRGDCLRACLASLFEIPYEDVPAFERHPKKGEEWIDEYRDWLDECGFTFASVNWMPHRGYVLCGVYSNFKGNPGHYVIFHDDELVHDPANSGEKYERKDVEECHIFIPHDLASIPKSDINFTTKKVSK